MRATAVGYQSVDRWSVQRKEGRKEEEGEEARANVERDAVSWFEEEEEVDEGKEEKGGRVNLHCRHIQFAPSSKIAVRNTACPRMAIGSNQEIRSIQEPHLQSR